MSCDCKQAGATPNSNEPCSCARVSELQQALDEITPLVQEILKLGTEMAYEVINNSPWWRTHLAFDEGTPIETIDHMLRKEGIDPEQVEADGQALKIAVKMAGAARRGLVHNMLLAMNDAHISDERSFHEFARALAKREGVSARTSSPRQGRLHIEVETDDGWES